MISNSFKDIDVWFGQFIHRSSILLKHFCIYKYLQHPNFPQNHKTGELFDARTISSYYAQSI